MSMRAFRKGETIELREALSGGVHIDPKAGAPATLLLQPSLAYAQLQMRKRKLKLLEIFYIY